jgi:preprotein translocase subunit SecE
MAETAMKGKLQTYFRELRAEMRKVVWPTFEQVRRNTGVVISAIILVAILLAVLDVAFGYGMNWILGAEA